MKINKIIIEKGDWDDGTCAGSTTMTFIASGASGYGASINKSGADTNCGFEEEIDTIYIYIETAGGTG